ncbi:MAG: hypothetical protein ACFFFK_12035, partial [Candidatus Thorarchaeota archaeon]
GKIALTTTNPTGLNRNLTIENAVAWSTAPSIILSELSLSQEIIWAGDQVTIFMKLTDLVGNEISSLDAHLFLNSSQFSINEDLDGYYYASVTGNWTRENIGNFNLLVVASSSGYDTLRLEIENFILIRPFPILMLAILGGGFIAVVGGWIYSRRKRGDSWRDKKTPQERKMEDERKKQDSKTDVKEYFGV